MRILTYAILQFQLKECILAIHRPYLQRDNNKFWLSENVSYHISRDILLLNSKLAGSGFQTLTLLREDLLLASLNLTRITMLQPKGWFSLASSSKAGVSRRPPHKGVFFSFLAFPSGRVSFGDTNIRGRLD